MYRTLSNLVSNILFSLGRFSSPAKNKRVEIFLESVKNQNEIDVFTSPVTEIEYTHTSTYTHKHTNRKPYMHA